MKRNIIYMVGALLSSTILTFSCAEDIPSYNKVTVDKNDLFIKIENHTAEVSITEGNGNYKVEVADENIVTAKLEGSKVIFTALKNGHTTVTVTDWAKQSTMINVRVKEDFDFTLDKHEVTMLKEVNPKEIVFIISGNDEYKVKSSDEKIAAAKIIDGSKIEITALSYGNAVITITDGDNLEQTIDVIAYEHLFEIGALPTDTWYPSEVKDIVIAKLGNGKYEIVDDYDTEIASVEIVENKIRITGNEKAGETTVTIKDEMGLEIKVPVKVEYKLIVEKTILDWMVANTPIEIKILFGSGNYTLAASDPSITCTLSEDKSTIIAIGTSRKSLQTITVTDTEWNLSVNIKILIIDTRSFLDYAARWYVRGSFQEGIAHSAISTDGAREHIKVAKGKTWTQALKDGWHISFEGGRELGKKTAPSGLYQINSSGGEAEVCAISDVEIVHKVQTDAEKENGKGKYWIRFKEAGREEYSYIVTWF